MFAPIIKSAVFLMLTLKAFSMPSPNDGCSQPLQEIPLYTDMFKDNYYNVTPKDVAAFKFFCIQNHVATIALNQFQDNVSDINTHKNSNVFTCVQEEDSFSRALENYFNNATIICKEYAGIKTYQFMLYQLLRYQATATVSNATIISIVYLLQKAGESLQEIQVSFIYMHAYL